MNLGAAMLLALHGWLPTIKAEARAAHVDYLTVAAIVWHESRGNPNGFLQHGKNCAVGLAGIYVLGCEPGRVSQLHDPVFNLRVSAQMLHANEKWCRRHKREKRCRAGERVFRGGGAVNLYGGNTTRYAGEILKLRRALVRELLATKRKHKHRSKS